MLCVINIYRKYAWFVLLKDKKRITITVAFQKILDKSVLKPNKIWVDCGIEFYNRSMGVVVVWQWNWNVFYAQQRKVCYLWKIYQNIEEKNILAYDCGIKKVVYQLAR